MTDKQKEIKGCEFCEDWPVYLHSRCHPIAPTRVELYEDNTLVVRCYLPDCGRELVRFTVSEWSDDDTTTKR